MTDMMFEQEHQCYLTGSFLIKIYIKTYLVGGFCSTKLNLHGISIFIG